MSQSLDARITNVCSGGRKKKLNASIETMLAVTPGTSPYREETSRTPAR